MDHTVTTSNRFHLVEVEEMAEVVVKDGRTRSLVQSPRMSKACSSSRSPV